MEESVFKYEDQIKCKFVMYILDQIRMEFNQRLTVRFVIVVPAK